MTTKRFNALPMGEKAVLVAKDIIKQLEANKYLATVGQYIGIVDMENVSAHDDIQKNFSKIKECEVCAIGAMLLSSTNLGNVLMFDDIGLGLGATRETPEGYAKDSIGTNNSIRIQSLIGSVFSPRQVLLIETAFEGYNHDGSDEEEDDDYLLYIDKELFEYGDGSTRYGAIVLGESLTQEECIECNRFHDKYIHDMNGRLLAICNNIVRNRGTFVLPDTTPYVPVESVKFYD